MSVRRWSVGLSLLGACAPHVTLVPSPVPVVALPAPVQAVPPPPLAPPAPPPSLLELATRGDLNLVTITEAEGCETGGTRMWIVSALDTHGAGATCLGDGGAAPRCILFAGITSEHLNDVMCKQSEAVRPIAIPAWAPEMLASLRSIPADQMWSIWPIEDAPRPALALQIDDQLFVAIRTEAGWQRSTEPVDRMRRLAARRVLDTSALTASPSFGVITSSYDGGSESGSETTTLTILRPTATGLTTVASIQIGQLTWILEAPDRKKYPKAAYSLDERPHVEVQLAPEVTSGVLSLRVERDVVSKEFAGRCVHTSDEDWVNPPCVRDAMKALAGRYRLTDEGLVAE